MEWQREQNMIFKTIDGGTLATQKFGKSYFILFCFFFVSNFNLTDKHT